MKIFLMAMQPDEYWSGIVYVLTMSDDHIPLWEKAGIYDLLYEREKVVCENAMPDLILALTDMCIQYMDYRSIVKMPEMRDAPGGFMDEMLREQAFRQAVAILSMFIQAAIRYPQSVITRKKTEEA